MAEKTPTAAQVTYTTNIATAPNFVGFGVAVILAVAQRYGWTFLDTPEMQAMLAMAIGWGIGAVGSWLFPVASGRLGISAPWAWSVPSPQAVSTGTSLVSIPSPASNTQVVTVRPANDMARTIRTAEVAAAVASANASIDAGRPVPVTVTVTSPDEPNKAVRVPTAEIRTAPMASAP